ncbi:MAG: isocitrate/isopropylmalate dehydrogenase family protein [Phycisphaerales bacterium]|nr:MAG: isocitrate/isopropylmalate dehydrogenase family protein [Phycisphaerales bacterium]
MTTRHARPLIALLPGDGIGPEVLHAARRVLDALAFEAEYIECDVGWRFWQTEGDALPERTIRALESCDAALFGAITSKPATEAEKELPPELRTGARRYTSPIVRLRQHFDLHTAIRPCRAYAGNPRNIRDATDLVVFRENTEGLYGGIEWRTLPEPLARVMSDPEHGHPDRMRRWFELGLDQVSLSTRFVSRPGAERIARSAFDYARAHGRRRVTLLEKPNVLRETGGVMTERFRAVASEFPEIDASEANMDAACTQLVMQPERFDVIVAENMFGDIVSDLAAGLVGGLGFAPSGNIGDRFAVFEPTHGSAPDIAGQNLANPIAMLLSARMMLEWLARDELAERLEAAIAGLIRDGLANTRDVALPGEPVATTGQITDRLIDRIQAHAPANPEPARS